MLTWHNQEIAQLSPDTFLLRGGVWAQPSVQLCSR